jgi:small-conductance mechanosensitive channel
MTDRRTPTHILPSRERVASVLFWAALAAVILPVSQAFGQTAPPAMLVYGNRPIIEFRASILARTPAERAAVAKSLIDKIVASGQSGPVQAQVDEGVMIMSVGNQNVFVIAAGDVDELAGETLEQKARLAVARLQTAVDEEIELRTPARLAVGAAQALAMTVLFVALLWGIRRGHGVLAERVPAGIEKQLERNLAGDLQLVQASRAGDVLRRFVLGVAVVLSLVLSYFWLTFVLRRFPYTRPWGESLREFLLARLATMGLDILRSIPDLFTVAVIIVITRFAVRFASAVFDAAEQERVTLPLVYPETAQPTRRLVTALLWLFALALSYPYLPGADSDAFKGVSLFVGLIVSLGSSGIVGQMMSGMTITYSRALRLGDFVRIGDIEGTVTHLGSLSTKIKSERREDITIPNAVVVSTPITNYSRFAQTEGVSVPVTITIGYDVPWRQIHAMLLLAAERTPGVKRSPAPLVRQWDFRDFHVQYALLTCLEDPRQRGVTMAALRSNIQDVFNEFGVQIMTPNYEGDPNAPKVVPRDMWYTAPASPPPAE